MYGLSNKKDVEEQFARQERRRTLLRRQHEQDQLRDIVDASDVVDSSPMLHHSMASQARRDNVLNLPRFLADHVDDPAIKASDFGRHVCAAHAYVPLLAQFHLVSKGPLVVKTTPPGLRWRQADVHPGGAK